MRIKDKLFRINMGNLSYLLKFILEGTNHRVFFPVLSRDHRVYINEIFISNFSEKISQSITNDSSLV